MAKITANNIQAGSITLDTLSSSIVNTLSSSNDTSTKTQAAFDKANTSASLAQSAFDAANTVSPLDSYSRQTANAAFEQANTVAGGLTTANNNITILQGINATQNANISLIETKAQAAFDKANTGGGASGGFINLNMPGTLNVPFTGTSRYYPTQTITLGTVYANLSASPSANLQFVILKNGANIGNSFIITTSSPVMTPVVLSGVSLTTNDYLTLNLLGSNITASDLWVRISYS